ncbi:hypothetical protein PLESTB_001724500 [Pleodorina starrii]|uniref:Homoserine dehydrogenase catalytic domain-containing protein n=1 Tax=Pleodorina starrii TaxID=330485 RepID=A0A9W6BZT8_9CHLO|nr:hypothetical protein PLESTB_001724500 [Pleodorina starrii]
MTSKRFRWQSEAHTVARAVAALLECGVEAEAVGVICFHRAQVEAIRSVLQAQTAAQGTAEPAAAAAAGLTASGTGPVAKGSAAASTSASAGGERAGGVQVATYSLTAAGRLYRPTGQAAAVGSGRVPGCWAERQPDGAHGHRQRVSAGKGGAGLDVARKVVILARECGLDVELGGMRVDSLVPEPLRGEAGVSAETFMESLPQVPVTAVAAYYDYPADPNDLTALVNNLNLELWAGEVAYLGNNPEDAADPAPDGANSLERVRLSSPPAGTDLRIVVRAPSLPSLALDPATPQRWTLAAVGHFEGVLRSELNPAWANVDALPDVPQTASPPARPPPLPPPLPPLPPLALPSSRGLDVARKVVILARECGLDVEPGGMRVDSLVPEPLRGEAGVSVETFMEALPQHDDAMAARAAEAAAAGGVVRYVGCVDMEAGTAGVTLRTYPSSHPFAQLSGSDNMVVFTTERYQDRPFIVR